MHELKASLDAIDPRLFHLAAAALIGAVVFAWRKLHPASWRALPKGLQALPALLMGAIVGGASGGELVDIVIGGFDGLIAVGGHHALKRAPGPYGVDPAR